MPPPPNRFSQPKPEPVDPAFILLNLQNLQNLPSISAYCCRAIWNIIRQSRPYSGRGLRHFQVKVLTTTELILSPLASGRKMEPWTLKDTQVVDPSMFQLRASGEGFRVEVSGFRVWSLGFGVEVLGLKSKDKSKMPLLLSRLWVQGSGLWVQGAGFRVAGLGLLQPATPNSRDVRTLCRANIAHIKQSRPDYGFGFQGKILKIFPVVPSSLGSGNHCKVCDQDEIVQCLRSAILRFPLRITSF